MAMLVAVLPGGTCMQVHGVKLGSEGQGVSGSLPATAVAAASMCVRVPEAAAGGFLCARRDQVEAAATCQMHTWCNDMHAAGGSPQVSGGRRRTLRWPNCSCSLSCHV